MDLPAFVGKRFAADEPDVLWEGVRVLAPAMTVLDAEMDALRTRPMLRSRSGS